MAAFYPSLAAADTRVALIIGNGAYRNAPRLPNPSHDATDVATALKRLGFQTTLATDLDKNAMEEVTIKFARTARNADVALFYYSGHAIQFANTNYLAPIDTQLGDEADLRRLIKVDDVMSDLQQAKNLRILVLDACRSNPLADELRRAIGTTRSVALQRGLARIERQEGMIVSYATQAGSTAEDGSGRNSPYTAAFLKNIEAQEEIGTIFRRISADVYDTTKHEQLPELSLSLIGEYYLRDKAPSNAGAVALLTNPDSDQKDFEAAERLDTAPGWDAFLSHHPNGYYAQLAKERRTKADGASQKSSISADGSSAAADLLFWKFVESHRSRKALESYLETFPNGYFVQAARAMLLNIRSEVATADGSLPAVDQWRRPEIMVANRTVSVFNNPNSLSDKAGDLPKGTQAIVTGRLAAGDILVVKSPYSGYAPARAFDSLDDAGRTSIVDLAEMRAAQKKLSLAISLFDDDAARLKAPVWGAVAVDKAGSFYGSTLKPDKDTATETVMKDCRAASKAGNCNLVRFLFHSCFALARKKSDQSKWAWAIRDTPEQARTDAAAACSKSRGGCQNSWLVCGDSRR